MAIVRSLLTALPDFELAYIRTYSAPQMETGAEELPLCPIATLRQKSSGVLFNLIPGGSFAMGVSSRQVAALREATAGRDMLREEARVIEYFESLEGTRVVPLRPFLLARFPLSRGEVVGLLGLDSEDEVPFTFDNVYVAGLPEEDVLPFLSASGFRLPSEAEWEYACRAGSDALFWCGDQIPDKRRWVKDRDSAEEADQYSNRFGLVDLAAYPESCADSEHDDLVHEPMDSPAGVEDGDSGRRITRGGAALDFPFQGLGEWAFLLSAGGHANIYEAIRPVFPLPDSVLP